MVNIPNQQQTPLRTADSTSAAKVAVWLPESNQLVVSVEQKVELWDLSSRQLVRTIDIGNSLITCLEATPDEKRLFVGSSSGMISVCNLETGRKVYAWQGHAHGRDDYHSGVTDFVVSHDGMTLYSAGSDGRILPRGLSRS